MYVPGEIIWFRGTIAGRSGTGLQDMSPDLNVNLYDASGKFIAGDKFRITDKMVSGDMRIPSPFTSGVYCLAAFTSLHTTPEEAFITG